MLGTAPKRPWDWPELVDGANIEVDGAAMEGAAPKSEDCGGCAVCADEASKIDLRFAGCSAFAPDPRPPNTPPRLEGV